MKAFAFASILSLAAAAPLVLSGIDTDTTTNANATTSSLAARGIDCTHLAFGLSHAACTHMASLGIAGQGANPRSASEGAIWLGGGGTWQLHIKNQNTGGEPVTLILWDETGRQWGGGSFVTAAAPTLSYTLAHGADVTVSMAEGRRGAFAGIYGTTTKLNQAGQIYNTWGEYSTAGAFATLDVSREPAMAGNHLSIRTDNQCASEYTRAAQRCVFTCTRTQQNAPWNNCGEAGTYDLINGAGVPHCAVGKDAGGQPSGGCQGWKTAEVLFL